MVIDRQQRKDRGLPRQVRQHHNIQPHPRRGGSQGYSLSHRQESIQNHNAGIAHTVSNASISTHYVKTGNRGDCKITGIDQINLIMYRQTCLSKSNIR